jgi:2-dehydro-3-deoxyglucarate aldolase
MIDAIRKRLAAGEPCIGAWLTAPSPLVAEAMASLGFFHWLAVDMEHTSITLETAMAAFAAAERHGCAPLVRLPSADSDIARRCLDIGCQGLIVPGVEDADAFAAFIEPCLHRPAGRRGVSLGRHNAWGDRFDDDRSTFKPLVVPMIESAAGAAAAAAIAGLDIVDAIFIGPWDLSGDLGDGGNFETPGFADAISRIRDACAAAGTPTGIHVAHPDAAKLAEAIDDGHRLVAFSTDLIALRQALDVGRAVAGE